MSGSLSALEVEDLVTVRDVATVLQRAEMVRRIAEEIEGYVVELGADGRLVMLQLEELIGGVEDDRRLVAKDYFQPSDRLGARRRASTELADLDDDETLLDLGRRRGGAAPRRRRSASTARCSRAASGCCTRSRGCPSSSSDHVVDALRQPAEDHAGRASPTSSTSRASARRGPGRSRTASRRLAETSILDRYV